MPERSDAQREMEIQAGYRCPDCDIPLLINPHLDDCPGVAAMLSAWYEAFPTAGVGVMRLPQVPNAGDAFSAAWWAGRRHERSSAETKGEK